VISLRKIALSCVVALLGGGFAVLTFAAEPSAWRLAAAGAARGASPEASARSARHIDAIWDRLEALRSTNGMAAASRTGRERAAVPLIPALTVGEREKSTPPSDPCVAQSSRATPGAGSTPAQGGPGAAPRTAQGPVAPLAADGKAPPVLTLLSSTLVDSEGVFLAQVIEVSPGQALPQVRLADAPAFGQSVTLTRTDILGVMRKAAPDLVSSHWGGAEQVRITRRSRILDEAGLKEQLGAVLQRDYVKNRGDLEIRMVRPWAPMLIPDEPLVLKILDLPASGVSPHFIVRFELSTARERLGAWQAPLQARIWRELWLARSPLRPGTLFSDADVTRERRDVLGIRDALLPDALPTATIELAEAVGAGTPIYLRSVRLRPVVHRGQVVEAQLVDGTMIISLKVEVLESGVPGQLVRVRNVQSKREFKGKVQDEQTILVLL
jgi:flagellar basal body P-ring formation protein FlgA